MKKVFLLLMMSMLIILIMSSVYGKEAKAYLYLYIINEPPSITGMSVYGFAETGLSCNASVEDESKEKVRMHYYWYKDDILVSNDKILDKSLIKEGDRITCKIVPDDTTQLGNPENITVSVLAEPINLKFNRITGSVIGGVVGNVNNNREISVIGLLSFLLIVLVIVNAVIIRNIKKSYSPHGVFGSH